MIGEAAQYTDTPTANNATFQQYNPFESRQDIVRIDWQAHRDSSASTAATCTTSTT